MKRSIVDEDLADTVFRQSTCRLGDINEHSDPVRAPVSEYDRSV